MLTNTKVNDLEDRCATLESMIDNTDCLIAENSIEEERVFYSSVFSDNLLNTFNSIYYQVNNNIVSEVTRHKNLLNKELRLSDMPARGSLEDKSATLLLRMKNEHLLDNAKKSLKHANPNARAFYRLLTAMSCTLHGEMMIALKILNMILIEGYSNFIDGSSCPNISGAGPA